MAVYPHLYQLAETLKDSADIEVRILQMSSANKLLACVILLSTWLGAPDFQRLQFYLITLRSYTCGCSKVFKMDADSNETDKRYFPEDHIPVMKLFLKGAKRSPVTFEGRTYDAMVCFPSPVFDIHL